MTMSTLIVYKMLLTLYDMVYCGVHVDCVQDVTLYDMVYCGVHVDCVQDVTYIVRHGLLCSGCLQDVV